MFAAVSGGRAGQLAWILGAVVVLGAGSVHAAEADVSVKCDALSAEDAAQVEARIRANMLSSGIQPATVALQCDGEAAQTQVTGNDHTVLLRASRNAPSLKDTLLANADAALVAWVSLGPPVAAFPPPAPAPPPAPPIPPSAPPASAPATTALPARVAAEPAAHGMRLAAGVRAERWHLGSALGAQLTLERPFSVTWVGAQVGYLVGLPTSSHFSARELQLGGELGWQPPGSFGIRGALTFGLSVLGATPESGARAQSSTTSSLPFFGVNFSRPLDLGWVGLVPVLGFRVFQRERGVNIDASEQLGLPSFALQASLNLALKLGG